MKFRMFNSKLLLWTIIALATLFLLWQLSLIAITLAHLIVGFRSSLLFHHKNLSTPQIAPIIHQMWKTSNLSTYPINTSCARWKKIFPDYTVRLWTDEDLYRLMSSNTYSYLLETYNSYPFNIQRADLGRLVVLHSEGGIYADLDVFPRDRSIDKLRSSGASLIVPRSLTDSNFINHFLVSERHSPVIEFILHQVPSVSLSGRILLLPYLQVFSTGSIFLTRTLRQWTKLSSNPEDHLWILSSDDVASYVGHDVGRSWHLIDGYILNKIEDKRRLIGRLLVCSLVLFFLFLKFCKKICIANHWKKKQLN